MTAILAARDRAQMSTQRSVTVIIPVYNGERYLAQAIDSVLKQTLLPTEVVVVDDGSTDGTASVAKGFGDPITYVYQQNAGTSAARNRGVKASTGELIAFLDADDLWVDEKLELQTAAFEASPDCDVVFGHVQEFFAEGLDEAKRRRIRRATNALPGLLPSAMLVRRESFRRVGGFAQELRHGEFASWYANAVAAGLRMRVIPEVVTLRRLHEKNKGLEFRDDAQREYLRALKAHIERRKAAFKSE